MYKSDFLFCFRIHNQISFYIFQIDSYFFLWLTFNMVCVCGGEIWQKKKRKKTVNQMTWPFPTFHFQMGTCVCMCVHVLMHACGSFLCVNSTKGQEFVESHDRQDLEGTQHIGGKASTRFEWNENINIPWLVQIPKMLLGRGGWMCVCVCERGGRPSKN